MSDEEEVVMSEEEEVEEEEATEEPAAEEEEVEEEEEEEESEEEEEMEPSGPSEAELAMKRKQAKEQYGELDEESQELLSNNAVDREKLGCEIEEMRKRSERRKKEREAEEKRLAAKRAEEEAERKAAEEERRRKKENDELDRKQKKLEKMAELERLKNPSRPNFVITKKDGPDGEELKVATEETAEPGEPKKSKEQLEAEKQAILKQRIPALDIDGADGAKLKSKANELHALILRLESEKYDLEKRFKNQQLDMMELAEKARNIHKAVGSEAIKRVALAVDETDKVQEKFAGCPSKVIMFSEFERQMDKRTYGDKRVNFVGPVFADPTAKISPKRLVKWDENTGLPSYEYMEGQAPPEDEEE